jgi:hypothetical protein
MNEKILKLNLNFVWYDFMVKGISNKDEEIRKPTKWIKSRLFNKDGSTYFETDFKGFIQSPFTNHKEYNNGERFVRIDKKDFIIKYSEILFESFASTSLVA